MRQLRQALESKYVFSKTEAGVYTYVDSADPIRFLLGGECPPFSPYRRLCTGALLERTRHGECRQKDGQRDTEKLVKIHAWARCCVNGGVNSGLFVDFACDRVMYSYTPHKQRRNGNERGQGV